MAKAEQDITGNKKKQTTSNWAPPWYTPTTWKFKSSTPYLLYGNLPDQNVYDLKLIPKQSTDYRGYLQRMYTYNDALEETKPTDTYENKGGGNTYKTPKKVKQEPGAALGLIPKYAAIAANVALNARNINKMYDVEKERVLPQVFAARTAILPEQDIPEEILQQRLNDIANLRSSYHGSDAVLDMLSQGMVNNTRLSEKNKLSAERAQQLQKEKERVSKAVGENQKANVEAMNKREQIRATEDVRQREIEKMRLEALNKLRTDTINAGVKEFENFANYEAERKLRTVENRRKQLMADINYNLQIANNPNIEPGQRTEALEAVKAARKEMNGLDLSLPSYGGIYRIFSKRNGGKLIAKS